MILLWIDQRYAREVPFGKNLCGISHKHERPDLAIFSCVEAIDVAPSNEVGFEIRSELIRRIIQAIKSNNPKDIVIY